MGHENCECEVEKENRSKLVVGLRDSNRAIMAGANTLGNVATLGGLINLLVRSDNGLQTNDKYYLGALTALGFAQWGGILYFLNKKKTRVKEEDEEDDEE